MSDQISRRSMLALTAASLATPYVPRLPVPPSIRGASRSETKKIAELGEAFRAKFELPGVSLAMSYRGQLKLLACFGMAD